jgi:hypothetical protein
VLNSPFLDAVVLSAKLAVVHRRLILGASVPRRLGLNGEAILRTMGPRISLLQYYYVRTGSEYLHTFFSTTATAGSHATEEVGRLCGALRRAARPSLVTVSRLRKNE